MCGKYMPKFGYVLGHRGPRGAVGASPGQLRIPTEKREVLQAHRRRSNAPQPILAIRFNAEHLEAACRVLADRDR